MATDNEWVMKILRVTQWVDSQTSPSCYSSESNLQSSNFPSRLIPPDRQKGLVAPRGWFPRDARLLLDGALGLGRTLDHAPGATGGTTLAGAGGGAGGFLLVLVLFWCFHSTLQHEPSTPSMRPTSLRRREAAPFNKASLSTPAPPRVQFVMMIQPSTHSRSRAPGQV